MSSSSGPITSQPTSTAETSTEVRERLDQLEKQLARERQKRRDNDCLLCCFFGSDVATTDDDCCCCCCCFSDVDGDGCCDGCDFT
ncbi:hypothetical protein BV898_06276 [Hypsibius exemplaris]|uniref:Uncharacterized protein n=1 Tax=Hypsibius exemplaris TaxID=2072580 RepID=A0A1W0WX08_HYPEX|nr:hypothetical protein BV898_06276 [Hypsibius exemplaris]